MSTERPVHGGLAAAADGPLVAVGISHRTATVALREQAALTESAARRLTTPEAVAAAGFHHTAHLFRVAAGLDSMVVGEPEVQHQVRRAHAVAADEGMLGPALEAVFRAALAIVADEVARRLGRVRARPVARFATAA